MLVALISLFFFGLISGAQVPQCSKLHVHLDAKDQGSSKIVYSFDVDVDVVQSSKEHYNLLTFSNYVNQSADGDVYKQDMPLQYWDGNEGVMIKCNFTDSCTIEVPDGVGLLELPLSLSGTRDFPELLDGIYFDSGILFLSYLGEFFDPNVGNCSGFEEFSQYVPNVLYFTTMCCREYSYITVPDQNDNPCVEFKSNTVFTSNTSPNNVISNFSANYALVDSEMVITVTYFTGPPTGNFYFSPNEDLIYCAGNTTGCDLRQPLSKYDFQFDFLLDVWDPYPQTFHYDAVTGKLIRRNGVYMKEEGTLYTPDDPCWTRVESGNNDSTATSRFCCSKFQNDLTVVCPQYESRSFAFQDQTLVTSLDIQYVVAQGSLSVSIINFTSSTDNSGQFEFFDPRGGVQNCGVNPSTVPANCSLSYKNNEAYEFDFRTSGFPEGFNMTLVSINNLQFESPGLSPDQLCQTFNQPYNGLDSSKSSKTEICCITQIGGPWPGSS